MAIVDAGINNFDPTSLPVGTIISSLLPPDVFLSKTDGGETWVFCDGEQLPKVRRGRKSQFEEFLFANRLDPNPFSTDLVDPGQETPRAPDLRALFCVA